MLQHSKCRNSYWDLDSRGAGTCRVLGQSGTQSDSGQSGWRDLAGFGTSPSTGTHSATRPRRDSYRDKAGRATGLGRGRAAGLLLKLAPGLEVGPRTGTRSETRSGPEGQLQGGNRAEEEGPTLRKISALQGAGKAKEEDSIPLLFFPFFYLLYFFSMHT